MKSLEKVAALFRVTQPFLKRLKKVGKVEKVGKVGKVEKVGKVGEKVEKVETVEKVEKVGEKVVRGGVCSTFPQSSPSQNGLLVIR